MIKTTDNVTVVLEHRLSIDGTFLSLSDNFIEIECDDKATYLIPLQEVKLIYKEHIR